MDYREIPLTRGKVARVSPQDYERAAALKWSALPAKYGVFYAYRRGHDESTGSNTLYLHRFLMMDALMLAPYGSIVSHLDGDGLNCTRSNMRVTNQAANRQHDGDRHAIQRVQAIVKRGQESRDYMARLGRLNARLSAEGIGAAGLASLLDRDEEFMTRLTDGLCRSVAFMAEAERALSLSPARHPAGSGEAS